MSCCFEAQKLEDSLNLKQPSCGITNVMCVCQSLTPCHRHAVSWSSPATQQTILRISFESNKKGFFFLFFFGTFSTSPTLEKVKIYWREAFWHSLERKSQLVHLSTLRIRLIPQEAGYLTHPPSHPIVLAWITTHTIQMGEFFPWSKFLFQFPQF